MAIVTVPFFDKFSGLYNFLCGCLIFVSFFNTFFNDPIFLVSLRTMTVVFGLRIVMKQAKKLLVFF